MIMFKTTANTRQTLILVAASALLLGALPLRAANTDERIEASARKSYVFKTYLAKDAIKTESKNGAVTYPTATTWESSVSSCSMASSSDPVKGFAAAASAMATGDQ